MTRRTVTRGIDLLLIALSLAAAYVVDRLVVPRDQFVSAPFAVPVLIAAFRLPTRGAIAAAVLVFALAAFSAIQDNAPIVPAVFHLLGLLLTSILAILLGHQRQVSAQLARDARDLLRQTQDARNTLQTIIETLPAGVLMSDATGKIVLANVAAHTILGGSVTGTAYGPTSAYRLECPDGTPFPASDLPLPRAIERGEATRDVDIRVRLENGNMRVILAGASPIRDEEGHITEAVSVFQDITERMQIEEALRASQESLARAQEVAHVGNWDRDLRTGQLRWSDEIFRIFGIAPPAFGGTLEAFLQRVHPDDRNLITQALTQALTQGRPYSIDHRIVRPDGTVRYVHEEAQVSRDATGHPVRIVGTIQDITERKQAEEERERLLRQVEVERARVEAIVSSSASAIIYLDAASGSVQANPAAIILFGHPFVPEEGRTQFLPQLLHPNGQPITIDELPSLRALRERTTVQEELIVVQPDGTQVPVLDSSAAVLTGGGQIVGAVAVFQDISALKEIERLREEWTSVIAHDLRQPVTVIIGYGSLLRMETDPSTTLRREVEHILTAAENLNKMIADLLDVSRIESRRLMLQPQPVDLPSLVSAVAERMTAAGTSAELEHPVHVNVVGSIAPVLADPGRIEQVLSNLLSNAAKYGFPDGEITVTVRQQSDNALTSVTNYGPGIPPEEVSRLFTRYYRTREARLGRTGGLGLGLYITKGIVEAHHGHIWVESIPNQTTTFFFTLPLASSVPH